MSKTSLLLVSLIAAIPGGFLVFQMVSVFLSSADKLNGGLMGLAGFALALGATPALMPIAILVLMGRDPSAKASKKEKAADEDEAVDDADAVAAESGEVEAAEAEELEAADDELEAEPLESDDELAVTNAELEIEEPADEFADDFSDDFADEPEEEEEAPKKKKKK